MGTARDRRHLALISIAVFVTATAMVARGQSSVLEAIAFASGVLCVWMGVKGSVWTFPLGLLNVGVYFVVFLESRLYGDMALQVVYFVMNGMGWYMWLFGGEARSALRIRRAERKELAIVVALIPLVALGLWRALTWLGGAATLADAVTTSISLGGQWLMNRKVVENWTLWIVADVLYVPLYLSRDLHLTAILYAVFLLMAVMGFREWSARAAEPPAA